MRVVSFSRVNDYFDVIYLPDMDEQYAMEVRGGLGQANGQIGLENGWMMERAIVKLDNRELGKFIFSNIQKLIDLGVASINPSSLLPEKTTSPGADEAGIKGLVDGKRVLLHIRYVVSATPGLYPILKSRETQNANATAGDPQEDHQHVLLPFQPYTSIAFNVRKHLLIELVNVNGANGE